MLVLIIFFPHVLFLKLTLVINWEFFCILLDSVNKLSKLKINDGNYKFLISSGTPIKKIPKWKIDESF